jgi:hypothetical protein
MTNPADIARFGEPEILELGTARAEVVHWSTPVNRGLDLCWLAPTVVDDWSRVHLQRADLLQLLHYVDYYETLPVTP